MADLERRIRMGEFAAGQKLPSEHDLADRYATTRARIRTVLASLQRRGVLASRPGTGWFVQAGRTLQSETRMRTFSEWAADHGRRFGGEITHRERSVADAREAGLLGIRLGDSVLRLVRVRLLDDRPVLVERSTWATWVMGFVDALPNDVPSIFDALALDGVNPMRGDHRIEAVAASSQDSRLLHVRRSSPLLQATRTSTTREGRPVDTGIDRYLPDMIAFDVRGGDLHRALLQSRG